MTDVESVLSEIGWFDPLYPLMFGPGPDWVADCLRWHGRVLTGRLWHWCGEWDWLPLDETCEGWPCGCFAMRGSGDAV